MEKKNTENIYVLHLDDESLITEQTLCSVLSFLEENPTPISEGLIVYPLREREKIKISNLMDTIRPFCCFECIDFMARGNPAYMHGSNLLVRSDIEEKVGWNNGKTIAEDSLFAVTARRKLGSKVFGWHGGIIEEKSPHSLHDLFRQRKRWFYGLVQNLNYFKLKDRISQIVRASLWCSGFVSGLVSIVSLFAIVIATITDNTQNMPFQSMPPEMRIFFGITSVLWLLSYQIGAYLNGKTLSPLRRLEYQVVTFVSSPFIGLIECSIPIFLLIHRPRTFEVIEK
jgi:cellulose synthase/poly-beta-1,6-N-acetylglucosamine synthase-like glycosyltransferase